MKLTYKKHILKFKFDAGTSRGVLKTHTTYLIFIEKNGVIGVGESAPLKGLSVDYNKLFETTLKSILNRIELISSNFKNLEDITTLLNTLNLDNLPSIRFGLEVAFLDLINGGNKVIFNNDFVNGHKVLINGLLWMGSKDFMLLQLEEKLKLGFSCVKMKIGAIDFKSELDVLRTIRERFSHNEIELRVDANGAFKVKDALKKIKLLDNFKIHSIEQPIESKLFDEMEEICSKSLIPIALDEELIGISNKNEKIELLKKIKPQYVIIKPTLIGGIFHSKEWIEIAENLNIGWWMTSALESNIGLNAISQFSCEYDLDIPQGLGTGSLYENNFESPLTVCNGSIFYDKSKKWEI